MMRAKRPFLAFSVSDLSLSWSLHAESYVQAARALEGIADEGQRSIVERVYRHVPTP